MITRRQMLTGATALAACGRRPPVPEPGAPVLPAVGVRNARFDDAKPFDWEGEAPEELPVHGIDVSRWQSAIDWPTARANGVNFVWIKATEGADGDTDNPLFEAQWRGAHAAGVPHGAYHHYYWCASAADQARALVRTAPREAGALPPAVDLEWNPRSPTCREKPSPAKVRAEVQHFADLVARAFGQRPVLYLTVDFFEENEMIRLDHEEFWLRSVSAHPSERYTRAGWSFWQYSGTGLVPGIAGRVDLNAFNGSADLWRRWLAARVIR